MISLRGSLERREGSIITVYQVLSAETAAQLAKDHGLSLFFIDGHMTTCKADLLEQAARTLRFPGYFGFNWDALEDCLTDLSWLEPSNGYLIIWGCASKLKMMYPHDFRTAMDIWESAVTFWASRSTPMYVIVQVDEP